MLSRAGHAAAACAPSGSRSRRAYEREAMTRCLGMHEAGVAASSTAGASSASDWTEHRGGREDGRRPASGSGRRDPKRWAWGSVLRGGGQGTRVCRRAGREDRSGRARPKAGVAARRESRRRAILDWSRGAQGKGTGLSDSGSSQVNGSGPAR
jgi:hypothetical protein